MSFQEVQGTESQDWVGLANYEIRDHQPALHEGVRQHRPLHARDAPDPDPRPVGARRLAGQRAGGQADPVPRRAVPAGAHLARGRQRHLPDRAGTERAAERRPSARRAAVAVWLEAADLAVPSMIIIAAWRWTGVNIIYFSSGLVNIPRELYEAAAHRRRKRVAHLPQHHAADDRADDPVRGRPVDHRRLPGLRRAAAALAGRELAPATAASRSPCSSTGPRSPPSTSGRPPRWASSSPRSSSLSRSSSSASSAAGGSDDHGRAPRRRAGERTATRVIGPRPRRGLPSKLGLAVLFLDPRVRVRRAALLDGPELAATAERDLRHRHHAAADGPDPRQLRAAAGRDTVRPMVLQLVTQSLGYADPDRGDLRDGRVRPGQVPVPRPDG